MIGLALLTCAQLSAQVWSVDYTLPTGASSAISRLEEAGDTYRVVFSGEPGQSAVVLDLDASDGSVIGTGTVAVPCQAMTLPDGRTFSVDVVEDTFRVVVSGLLADCSLASDADVNTFAPTPGFVPEFLRTRSLGSYFNPVTNSITWFTPSYDTTGGDLQVDIYRIEVDATSLEERTREILVSDVAPYEPFIRRVVEGEGVLLSIRIDLGTEAYYFLPFDQASPLLQSNEFKYGGGNGTTGKPIGADGYLATSYSAGGRYQSSVLHYVNYLRDVPGPVLTGFGSFNQYSAHMRISSSDCRGTECVIAGKLFQSGSEPTRVLAVNRSTLDSVELWRAQIERYAYRTIYAALATSDGGALVAFNGGLVDSAGRDFSIIKIGADGDYLGAVGIVDPRADVGLRLSPNPAQDVLDIRVDAEALAGGSPEYHIYAIDGRLVGRGMLGGTQESLAVGHLSPGLYQVVFPTLGVTERFVRK